MLRKREYCMAVSEYASVASCTWSTMAGPGTTKLTSQAWAVASVRQEATQQHRQGVFPPLQEPQVGAGALQAAACRLGGGAAAAAGGQSCCSQRCRQHYGVNPLTCLCVCRKVLLATVLCLHAALTTWHTISIPQAARIPSGVVTSGRWDSVYSMHITCHNASCRHVRGADVTGWQLGWMLAESAELADFTPGTTEAGRCRGAGCIC